MSCPCSETASLSLRNCSCEDPLSQGIHPYFLSLPNPLLYSTPLHNCFTPAFISLTLTLSFSIRNAPIQACYLHSCPSLHLSPNLLKLLCKLLTCPVPKPPSMPTSLVALFQVSPVSLEDHRLCRGIYAVSHLPPPPTPSPCPQAEGTEREQ